MKKQYAIKMDFKKWEGSKRDLTNSKVYHIYPNNHWGWCFNDDVRYERPCWMFKDWGDPDKLNTDLAFELNEYKTKTTRFKIFMYVLFGYISILGFLSCIMFGEFIK